MHVLSVRFEFFVMFSTESVQQEQLEEPVATDKTGKLTHLCKM